MGCASSSFLSRQNIHEVYSFHEKLGQGTYGQVRSCTHRDTRLPHAVKIIDLDGSRQQKADTKSEAMLWKRVGKHANVVSLLETYSDAAFQYFVMERCERSLCDMLVNKERLREVDLLSTFRQMLLGLQQCHSMHVVHRDVKPANFLVSADGSVKICDFGLACLEEPDGNFGITGTAPFMSPEMLLGFAYDRKTDIWSCGATAYLMLYGQYPYYRPKNEMRSASEMIKRAIATNSPKPTYKAKQGVSEPSVLARDFVKVLLNRDATKRPSAEECLYLPAVQLSHHVALQAASSEDASTGRTVAVRNVQRMEKELKPCVDPTVAKSMDVLLEQLQAEFRGALSRSFSLPANGEKSTATSRVSRSVSHGGELSQSMSVFADQLSECSTTASSESHKYCL
jgi:serine/threonine protein kinase